MPVDPKTEPVERILDAAARCYLRDGIDKTNMETVAGSAGVARSTLYRYFPTRDELLVAVILREMLALGDVMTRRLTRYPDPADHLVEGLVLALEEIPSRPLLKAVFAGDEGSRARRAVWASQEIVELGNQFMEHVVAPALDRGSVQAGVRPEILTEWVYRVLLSFLTLPSNAIRNRKELRSTLHALLVPVLLP